MPSGPPGSKFLAIKVLPQPRIGLTLGSRVESCEVEILFQDAEPSQLLPVLHRLDPLREPALLASIGRVPEGGGSRDDRRWP